MLEIVRHDAPWVWGVNPEMLTLSQQWINPVKPNAFSYNTLKYMTVEVTMRNLFREQWNQALLGPLLFLLLIVILIFVSLFWIYRQQEKKGAPREKL